MSPNLFDYATSELSQDAFFAWLIAYADNRCADDSTGAHQTGRRLLDFILEKSKNRRFEGAIEVFVERQHRHIDIFATVKEVSSGEQFVLVFEDKAGTGAHDDQLKRYREVVLEEGLKIDQLLLVYCQTHNESHCADAEKLGYLSLGRQAILEVLSEATDNLIIESFKRRLNEIETATNGWKTTAPRNSKGKDNWSWLAWQGFFMALSERLGAGAWSYVPNPSGGFLGFWWYWKSISGGSIYLQLEEGKACFKIETGDGVDPNELKWPWHEKVVAKAAELGLGAIKPPVMRKGSYMTIAILPVDYRKVKTVGAAEVFDFDATVAVLKEMERVIDAID